ncbi:MAG: hypothetical protein HIU93_16845 [Acidobacteria bacterium]|nr:hypothetical protein [Acidobacteriota bacterium]
MAQVPHHEYGIVQVTSTEDPKINMTELTWHEIEGTLHFAGEGSTTNSLPQSIELEGGADHPGWKMEATVKSDGSFRFPPVVDGRYVLRTSPGSESYVDSISSSGKTMPGDRMMLNSGTGNMQVSVTLGVTHASMTGTLGTEDVIPDKTGVVLESLADGSVSIAMADRSGTFDFRNLAPGEYRAFAWSDLNKAEYRNPSFLARFKDKSKDITIDAQSPVSGVELSLIAATS